MSEQATMTREQLEAAGYVFIPVGVGGWHKWEVSFVVEEHQWICEGPLQLNPFSHDRVSVQVLQAATAHYRQQQELAALREFKQAVKQEAIKEPLIDDPDIINATFAIQVVQIYRKVFGVSIFDVPTVSESERAE